MQEAVEVFGDQPRPDRVDREAALETLEGDVREPLLGSMCIAIVQEARAVDDEVHAVRLGGNRGGGGGHRGLGGDVQVEWADARAVLPGESGEAVLSLGAS